MPRYAIVNGSTVENVAIYATQPTIPGRTAVLLTTEAVSPGDTYSGGVFTARLVSALETRATLARARLVSGRARLQQIRDQAATNSNVTIGSLAQAQSAIRAIAAGIADLAQNILDLELIAAFQEDNGAD